MQLFTADQLLDMRIQAWSLARDFMGSIMQVLWQSIINFFPSLIGAFEAGDWIEVIMRLSILVGSIVMIYRLLCKMPIRILNSMTEI